MSDLKVTYPKQLQERFNEKAPAMAKSKYLISFLTIALVNSFADVEKSESTIKGIDSLFKEIGFSPDCVSQTLALCESSTSDSFLLGLKIQLRSLQNSIDKLKEVPKRPRNCHDLFKDGDKKSGVRTVYPFSCCENRPISVFCDQTTDGGGWTVFQHREALPQRENFFKNWIEYKHGFGNLTGEFWLGLDIIHALVSEIVMELRVDLEDFEGEKRWAKYKPFYIGDATDKYRLDFGEYSGSAGNSLVSHNGQKFSTKDQDNDSNVDGSCSKAYRGAWWYEKCHGSNLNGHQYEGNHTTYADGINWKDFRGYHYSLKKTSLSLRPKFCN